MQPEALLAIRSDIVSTVEPEYLEWLTREHTLERVGIEGFFSARIFRSQRIGFGRYFILYELANEGVVDSPAYLERLNNPTPWTTRMMPHLGNFVRGGGSHNICCDPRHLLQAEVESGPTRGPDDEAIEVQRGSDHRHPA